MATPSEQTKSNANRTDSSRSQEDEEEKLSEVVGDLLTSVQDVQVGMKLEAKDAYGKWYMAKVVEVQEEEEEVLVHFERWNSRYDEYLKMSSERLRVLLPARRETLQRESDRLKKNLAIGDLVQAKWEDGRMYFAKVLKIYKDEVGVLFDDGVEYKAPLSAVRKRSHTSRSYLSKSTLYESDGSQTVNSRTLRAKKRHKSEDSTSQASCSSPPSSPVFMPSKKQRILDSDSSYSDSDDARSFDDSFKLPTLRKRVCKLSVSASSDSDASLTPIPIRKRKKLYIERTDAYKLRKSTAHLSPVKEYSEKKVDAAKAHSETNMMKVDTAKSHSETNMMKVDTAKEHSETNMMKVDTAKSHSETNMMKVDVTKVQFETKLDATEVPMPNKEKAVISTTLATTSPTGSKEETTAVQSSGTKSAKKSPTVAQRTRAHTKFDNVPLRRSDPKKPIKMAPKEMVIVWDHNEFKCKVTGCTKSFRKDSLLQSHIKHYHSLHKPAMRQKAGHSSVTDKKETSNSPSVSVTDKGKRQSLSPAMESPQAFISAQQSSKPPKISPKSGARKNQKSVEGVKHNETTVPDSNHRNHSSAQLDVTPASKHTSKAAKKAGGLPLASTHLKVPLVELKTVPKESPISPKKRYKSGSFSKCEEEFPTDVPMEDVAVSLVSSGGVLDMGNDVVHCVCRDVTDEGFMIQCEECLCWQHGDCVRMTESTLPDRYTCYFCSNPPGLRNRLKYQFDKDWFGEGSLPSVLGGPQFSHSSVIKHTHQLTDSLYQLKKVLHSSKVKLQAVSRINHPYMRQWAKECSHAGKKDISPYLISALVPISYTPDSLEQPTNGDARGNGIHNGDDEDSHAHNDNIVDLTTLQLDPLPHSVNESSCTTTTGEALSGSPDPKTLKLAPLPPLKTENLTSDILTKSIDLSTATTGENSSHLIIDTKVIKTEPHEVLNNEFGVQELSVFAVASERAQTPPHSKNAHVSHTPINAPTPLTVTTLYPNSTPLTAGPPQTIPSKTLPVSSTPKLTSTMDSVSLEEFADAFMQGDTTNWYQRMKLLDHIESVQERVGMCMESIETQLEELPPETEGLEKVDELLLQVQSTMTQLRRIQVASQT